jgi:hypothetical protein
MSILPKFMIATLLCGAALAAPSAALASTTQHTGPQAGPASAVASAASAAIHRAPCTRLTFNVYYGTSKKACYAGIGILPVRIPDVRMITTGDNKGYFIIRTETGLQYHFFTPDEFFLFPPPHPELLYLRIEPLQAAR